jgi:hypothetical protein
MDEETGLTDRLVNKDDQNENRNQNDDNLKNRKNNVDEEKLLEIGYLEWLWSSWTMLPTTHKFSSPSDSNGSLNIDFSSLCTGQVKTIAKALKSKRLRTLRLSSSVENESLTQLLKIGLKHRHHQQQQQQQPLQMLCLDTGHKSTSLLTLFAGYPTNTLQLASLGSVFEDEPDVLSFLESLLTHHISVLEVRGPGSVFFGEQAWNVSEFAEQVVRLLQKANVPAVGDFHYESAPSPGLKRIDFDQLQMTQECLDQLLDTLAKNEYYHRDLESCQIGGANVTLLGVLRMGELRCLPNWEVFLRSCNALDTLTVFGGAADSLLVSGALQNIDWTLTNIKSIELHACSRGTKIAKLIEGQVVSSSLQSIDLSCCQDCATSAILPSLLASALEKNTTLRSFQFRESENVFLSSDETLSKRRSTCLQLVKVLEVNRTLETFQFLSLGDAQGDESIALALFNAIRNNKTVQRIFNSDAVHPRSSCCNDRAHEISESVLAMLEFNKLGRFDLKEEIASTVDASTKLLRTTTSSLTPSNPPPPKSSELCKCAICSTLTIDENLLDCRNLDCQGRICCRCMELQLVEDGELGKPRIACPCCLAPEMFHVSKDLYGFVSYFHYDLFSDAVFRKRYGIEK